MSKPLISIIIPVYNTGVCLNKCIDSIVSQSFRNWEVVLVDDGNQEPTARICDTWAVKDSRIRVFHKINEGVSATRNRGIVEAQGDWISFIDADDTISEDYLEKLIKNLDADFILCGFTSSQGINVYPAEKKWDCTEIGSGVDFVVKDKHLLFAPWCKLFKKSILKEQSLSFDTSLRLSEDTVFCYQYLYYCKSLRIVHSNGYYYDGVWGGGKKYNLTLDEVLYLENAQVKAIKQLNDKFGCFIDYKYKGYRYAHISELYASLSLREIYLFYNKINDAITWEEFQADPSFNMISRSFEMMCSINGTMLDLQKAQSHIIRFYTSSILGAKGVSPSVGLFAFFHNHHLHLLNRLYVRMYSNIKKNKKE